ncbi:hypothetical protein JCGZ_01736 [Jatropha curcas]|uniref:Uncharacterized protein n=1 Tax=Jatropha curcas TaxID=180498 RepID=A0A067JTV2_JATCU|nr:hypothetical protein JCGZ_01736 [Jatropha curcas]
MIPETTALMYNTIFLKFTIRLLSSTFRPSLDGNETATGPPLRWILWFPPSLLMIGPPEARRGDFLSFLLQQFRSPAISGDSSVVELQGESRSTQLLHTNVFHQRIDGNGGGNGSHHERRRGEGCGGRSGETSHYLLKTTLYPASTNDFDHFGVRIAKFWAKIEFPATVDGGEGGGPATGRSSAKDMRRSTPLPHANISPPSSKMKDGFEHLVNFRVWECKNRSNPIKADFPATMYSSASRAPARTEWQNPLLNAVTVMV